MQFMRSIGIRGATTWASAAAVSDGYEVRLQPPLLKLAISFRRPDGSVRSTSRNFRRQIRNLTKLKSGASMSRSPAWRFFRAFRIVPRNRYGNAAVSQVRSIGRDTDRREQSPPSGSSRPPKCLLTNLVREQHHRRGEAAAALDRGNLLFPRRSGRGGTRHARHDPPASIREGRTCFGHDARRLSRRTRANDRLRRGSAEAARVAFSHDGLVHWRHGFYLAENP